MFAHSLRLAGRGFAEVRTGWSLLRALPGEERKPFGRIVRELIQYSVRTRELPRYYFSAMMYRRVVGHAGDYLSHREIARIERAVYHPDVVPFFKNKVLFQQHFSGSGLRLPRYFGYNVGERFFTPEGSRPMTTLAEFRRLAEGLLARCTTAALFAKPVGGTSGKGAHRIDAAALASDGLAALFTAARRGSYLFQECIAQHPALSAIYPHSVNSLRVLTVAGTDGAVHVIGAGIRFGTDGKITDNVSAGGIDVAVQIETGTLGRTASRGMAHGGTEYVRHPDTGVEFEGFALPHFPAVLETARTAAALLPYRLVGWDVAIAENGPVLVEGNNKPHLPSMDIIVGGLRRHPVFASLMRELRVG